MKRSAIRRKVGLKASKQGLKRSRLRVVNQKRKASELLRCYGPPKRRAWIKSLPCEHCGLVGQSQNAHVVTGGMGRKAGYEMIVPLCVWCHRAYDQHRPPFDTDKARFRIKIMASPYEARWQESLLRRSTAA